MLHSVPSRSIHWGVSTSYQPSREVLPPSCVWEIMPTMVPQLWRAWTSISAEWICSQAGQASALSMWFNLLVKSKNAECIINECIYLYRRKNPQKGKTSWRCASIPCNHPGLASHNEHQLKSYRNTSLETEVGVAPQASRRRRLMKDEVGIKAWRDGAQWKFKDVAWYTFKA